ncbi:MAG: class I SAM-dependent methyltransferase, partial [Bacillota bacterium]|nr:class I SAM-dependent methyltransferase [Bacillota bacterium]
FKNRLYFDLQLNSCVYLYITSTFMAIYPANLRNFRGFRRGIIDEYGIQNRAGIISGDFTRDDIGEDYDIVFSALSFAGNNEETLAFYIKVYAALKKGGLFILQTFTVDNDRKGPLFTISSDLREYMSGVKNRHSFTEREMLAILTESGFTGEQIVDMSEWWGMPTRMIIARK